MPVIEPGHKPIARAIAAWVRAEAESKDDAAACEWRNVADAIEREADDDHWLCGDCKALNGDHEAFCFRCGAGQPEPTVEPCARCGGSGRVSHFVPLFPQIDEKACPDCRPDERVCMCCGTISPGDDCATCDERREARSAR